MSLPPAAVPLKCSRDPAGPRVRIVGRGVARLETPLALRALAEDRLEITSPAPDLRFINRSISAPQPFNPRRVGGVRLEDTAGGLDDWWDRRILNRFEHEGPRTHLEILGQRAASVRRARQGTVARRRSPSSLRQKPAT